MTAPALPGAQCDDTCTTDCGHCKGSSLIRSKTRTIIGLAVDRDNERVLRERAERTATSQAWRIAGVLALLDTFDPTSGSARTQTLISDLRSTLGRDWVQRSIWHEVQAERDRAHAMHGDTSMESLPVEDLTRLTVLLEEVGEVARWFNESRRRDMQNGELRAELIQVAAMAGAWADALTDRPQAVTT